jgi:hypothetical protein
MNHGASKSSGVSAASSVSMDLFNSQRLDFQLGAAYLFGPLIGLAARPADELWCAHGNSALFAQ